ncbi:MAG: hypothetical protein JSS86_06830 [Cyanobacteria bacterium SZAS LIN-2]|nr:hypothetical protein [Cyanobacteria bacterium SZAS LIN-3]MBS1996006.1 hypothetical protein [Cyanobacteria bacterium SZAS LIN-2]
MRLSRLSLLACVLILILGCALALEEALAWSRLATLWDSDLVSYLDNGDAFISGNWPLFVNPYWAPLYGIIVASVLKLVQPEASEQLLVVRLTNVFIYLLLTGSFCYFARQLALKMLDNFRLAGHEEGGKAFIAVIMPFLCTLFVYSALVLGQTIYGTPDLLSSALSFLACALALKLIMAPSIVLAIILGIVCALGYFSKSPILFFSILLLVTLIPQARAPHALRPRHLLAALATLLITVAPFVAAISIKAGHFTISDIWRVGQSWNIFWTSPILHARGKEFVHPTRLIRDKPEIYEFGKEFKGSTYAAWYAPYYWYEGVPIKIIWHEYLPRVAGNVVRYLFHFAGGFLLFLTLILASMRDRFNRQSVLAALPILLPSLAGLGFMMVGIDLTINSDRYYTPYVVPLYAALFLAFAAAPSDWQRRLMTVIMVLMSLFMTGRMLLVAANYSRLFYDQASLGEGFSDIERHIPRTLSQAGINAGDQVAQIGNARYYFAKLARLQIIADIPSARDFWKLSEAEREDIYRQLKALGARAIIQEPYLKQVPYELKRDELPDANKARGWLTNSSDGQDRPVPVPEEKERRSTFMFKLLQ